jgi:tetratricopeptide (TPR) repeat protein
MSEVVTLFKHNPPMQEPRILEAITVQREGLIGELVAGALDTQGESRHRLLVGPRGMGKTHVLSLVASRVREDPRGTEVVVSWLEEDAWKVRTYGKLLAAIVGRVGVALKDEGLERKARELSPGDAARAAEAESTLREVIGDRRLLLLVENLDQIFRKIGPVGQAEFRAFVEAWGHLLIFATSPRLFEGVTEEASPFGEFFAQIRLEELTVDSAMDLMRRIATLNDDREVLRYLDDERAEKRFRAIEALAGGHPRIWLLFAGCISVEAIDELVPLFLQALDDLTPYYQDRLRELGDQQQEVVVLLAEAGGALSNRDLADRSGIPQNQIATMVRQLTERGYVRSALVPEGLGGGDDRLSFWELREPLMRLCLDVKQTRGEPLRMVIEFLRAWYGSSLLDELRRLPPEAELATVYASEAFRTLEGPLDFEGLLQGSPSEITARAELGLSLVPERFDLQLAKALGHYLGEEYEDAKEELSRLGETAGNDISKAVLSVLVKLTDQALGGQVDFENVFDDLATIREADSDNPRALAFVGEILALFGRSQEALAAYAKAVELEPENAELRSDLGRTLLALEREEDALDAFTKAVELTPEKVNYHRQRALALGNLGRHEEALEAFTAAAGLDPSDAESHVNRGIALRNLGRLEEALAAIGTAAQLEPEDVTLHERRAQLLLVLRRREEAAEAFARAIELDPTRAMTLSNLGAVLGDLGRTEEALAAFDRATELDPEEADFHTNRGTALHRLGRTAEAEAAYSKALELDPENAIALAGSGSMLARLGRSEEALEAIAAAIALDPERAVLHERKGIALNDLDRPAEALRAFDRAVELDPSRAPVWNNRGVALVDLSRNEDALEAFTKAAELEPSNPTYEGNRGSALGRLGRFDEALDAFGAALASAPDNATLHQQRGFALADLDRGEEAVEAFEKALELDPENAALHNALADNLLALGRLGEADQAVRRAIELDGADGATAIFRFTLAEVTLASGDLDGALATLREALAAWREDPKKEETGDADLFCEILWHEFRDGPELGRAIAAIAEAYGAAGAADKLRHGMVASIPLFVDDEAGQPEAEAWVEAWAHGAQNLDLDIPLDLMRAALAWKRDRDRAHLLGLPPEQREILIDLLES